MKFIQIYFALMLFLLSSCSLKDCEDYPLYESINAGDLSDVRNILNEKDGDNLFCPEENPVRFAAENNHKEIARTLLSDSRFNINREAYDDSEVPISWIIASKGWFDLLPKDFNVNRSRNGRSGFLYACQYSGYDVIKALNTESLIVNQVDSTGKNCLHLLANRYPSSELSRNGDKIVGVLLNAGISSNQVSNLGAVPLKAIIEAKRRVSTQKEEAMRMVIARQLITSKRFNPNIYGTGVPPLVLSFELDDKEIFQLLLSAGAKVNAPFCSAYGLHCYSGMNELAEIKGTKKKLKRWLSESSQSE